MRPRFAGPRLSLAAGALLVALAAGVALRPGGSEHHALPAVVHLSPGAVRHLVIETGGRQAELTRDTRGWSAHPGTPPQSARLLFSAEDKLFPMRAYRVLRADPADPQYGLGEPSAVVRLHDHAGRPIGIRIGAASFSGAGFYARQDGDPERVYLVPRNTLDLLRSVTTGERANGADALQERAGRYQAEQKKAEQDKETSVYLRQVLDAGGQPPPPQP